MKTIQLHIPDDLADKVLRMTGNAETYIIEMLRSKIGGIDSSGTLSEQYRLAAQENKSIQKEFVSTDLEGWDDEY
jgi:hypothetical protein